MFGHFTTLCMKGLRKLLNIFDYETISQKQSNSNNIPTRIIKEFGDLIAAFFFQNFNEFPET